MSDSWDWHLRNAPQFSARSLTKPMTQKLLERSSNIHLRVLSLKKGTGMLNYVTAHSIRTQMYSNMVFI